MKKYQNGILWAKEKEGFTTPLMFTNKNLVFLILPLIVEQLLAVLVGMIDTVMISGVGEDAVSGVSLVDTVMVLLINVFAALATGGAVVAGHYIGQRKEQDASKAAEQLLVFVFYLSIGVTLLFYLARNLILNGVFGNITPEVMDHANTYLLIVAASIPFIALYNGGAAIFRAMGNSKVPMVIALLMNIINIIGNAIGIYGLKIGTAGAAIATLVSRAVAAVVIILLLCSPKNPVRIRRKLDLHLEKKIVGKILHIGVPNGLENSMFQLGKILVMSLVTSFGTTAIAANAVSNNIAMFQNLPGISMGFAMLTVVSQALGAKDYAQAKYFTKKLMFLIYVCTWVNILLIIAALPLILKLYNLSPETMDLARSILIYHGILAMLIWPMSFSLPNTLRAAGDVQYTMIWSIVSMWVWRILFSFVLGKYFDLGLFGVWIAMTIDWLFRAICFILRYARGKWQYKEV